MTHTMTDTDKIRSALDLRRLYGEPPAGVDPVAWWKLVLEHEDEISEETLDDALATLLEAIQFQR